MIGSFCLLLLLLIDVTSNYFVFFTVQIWGFVEAVLFA